MRLDGGGLERSEASAQRKSLLPNNINHIINDLLFVASILTFPAHSLIACRLKEAGDDKYKAADFEGAIAEYTKCIDALGEMSSPLAIKALSNRAACYKQISNCDGTISDCTMVLEADNNNVKALVRRAQAFEAVERYKYALQDVKQVLSQPYNDVGEANYKLCNGMQHRLNRVVQQLKSMS